MRIFLIDIIGSLATKLLTILKLQLRAKLFGASSELSDSIWKIDRFLNLIRAPLFDTTFQNIITSNITTDASFNSLLLLGLIFTIGIMVLIAIKYLAMFKFIGIKSYDKNLYNILLSCSITIPLLFLYGVCFAKISRTKYRLYGTISLTLGNTVFVCLLLLGIPVVVSWIIGNIAYAAVPASICLYFFSQIHSYTSMFSIIPKSFFIGVFNIYWPRVIEFMFDQFVINKMGTGNLSEMNYGNKISDFVTSCITKPLIREMIANFKNDSTEQIEKAHSIIIFPIVFMIFNINIIFGASWMPAFNNKMTAIQSSILHLIYTYIASMASVVKTGAISQNKNRIIFVATMIAIILRIAIMIGLSFMIRAHLAMGISSILSSIFELLYIMHMNKVVITNKRSMLMTTFISCSLALITSLISTWSPFPIITLMICSIIFYYAYEYLTNL